MIAVTGASGGVGGRVARARAAPDGHDGRTYDLTGPEALTLDESLSHLRR